MRSYVCSMCDKIVRESSMNLLSATSYLCDDCKDIFREIILDKKSEKLYVQEGITANQY